MHALKNDLGGNVKPAGEPRYAGNDDLGPKDQTSKPIEDTFENLMKNIPAVAKDSSTGG